MNVNMLLYAVIALLVYGCAEVESSDSSERSHAWKYSRTAGEERWPGACETGKKQSPIDIADSDVDVERSFGIRFSDYDRPVEFRTENDGHTVTLKTNPARRPRIREGNAKTEYPLLQVHFHWMSEHTLEGRRYPMEAHFVHMSERYGAPSEIRDGKGLHVLAVLFYINKNDNAALNGLLEALEKTSSVGSVGRALLPLRAMLPLHVGEFYRYEGSLTTPGCDEIVQWTVFRSKVPISARQYEIVKRVETNNGSHSANYRHARPLNGRKVSLVYAADSQSRASGSVAVVSTLLMIKYVI